MTHLPEYRKRPPCNERPVPDHGSPDTSRHRQRCGTIRSCCRLPGKRTTTLVNERLSGAAIRKAKCRCYGYPSTAPSSCRNIFLEQPAVLLGEAASRRQQPSARRRCPNRMLRAETNSEAVPSIYGRDDERKLNPLLLVESCGQCRIIRIRRTACFDTGQSLGPSKRRSLFRVEYRAFTPSA